LFQRDIWEREAEPTGLSQRLLLKLFRLGSVVENGFTQHALTTRAAALTYTTVFSLVPTIAVALAMFKAFGGMDDAKAIVLSYVTRYLAVGVREEFAIRIEGILHNVSGGAIGAVGSLVVILAAFSLLRSMEDVLNEIWCVKRSRGYLQRFVIYWFMLTITPLVLFAVSVPSVLTKIGPLRWVLDQTGTAEFFFTILLPLAFVCFGFALMYSVLTSARIPWRSAAIGGIFGGTLWSAAVYGYASYAQHSDFYTTVYGSLSAIPIFLFWLYVSWLIVLLGAQVAFASNNISTYREELLAANASRAARELLALRIAVEVAGRFERGEPPIRREDLPQALQASGRLANKVVDELIEIGVLVQVEADERIAPARDPARITPTELLELLHERGEQRIWLTRDELTERLDALRGQISKACRDATRDISIADLALEKPKDR
jgi:membrane protein